MHTMPIAPAEQYPGYPAERLTLAIPAEYPLQGIDIPIGPWELNGDPLPEPQEAQALRQAGYALDSLGRPLHPWARQLLSDEHGGIVTGKGRYWNWGPNATADPIIITSEERPRILLIKRSDTGKLALPGGFVDGTEDPLLAAIRETQEETELELHQPGRLIYRGPVADPRTTLHAWAETSAYLFTVDHPDAVAGNDDALSAAWYFIDDVPGILFGSHAALVEMALTIDTGHTTSI